MTAMFSARELLALAAVAVLSSLCTAWLLRPACDTAEPLVEVSGGRRRLLQVPSTVLSYDSATGTLTLKAWRLVLAGSSSVVIQGGNAVKVWSSKTGRIVLATGAGASGETAGVIQLAPGGVPLTFSRVGPISTSVNADTLDVTDFEGNRIRWAQATTTQPGGLQVYATEKLGLYTTVSSGPGKSGMELATAAGGGGGLAADTISVAPGGMPNPLVFAASGVDPTALLVGRSSSVSLPSYLYWAQMKATDPQLIYTLNTACVTLVLAGFYIEEIAGVRQLLDEVGAAEVKVVPTTPARLHRPLGEVLATPEPQWDQPVPDDWQAGGGWGQQPMVLMAGLDQQGANILLDLLEEAVSSSICPAFAAPENLNAPLGEVLAAALKLWRQSGGSSSGAAAAAAAGSAASDAAEGLRFAEELPPLEELLAQPEGQTEEASTSGSGSKAAAVSSSVTSGGSSGDSKQAGGRAGATSTASSSSSSPSSAVSKARQLGVSPAPEVVQAEFRERPAVPPSAAEDSEQEEGVPLDLIDAIATGSEPQGPPTTAADGPAAPAVPAAPAEEGGEAGSMSSEELLAATRAALGLDSADLQRLVEEAAAKAAAATGVPFVPGSAAGGVSSGFPSSSPEPAAAAAAPAPSVRPAPKSSGGSSPKPWEAAANAPAPTPGGSSPAAGTASKGFGRPAPPSRKAAKAARRQATSKSSSSSGAAGQPAAAAQAVPGPGSGAAPSAQQQPEREEQQQEEEHVEERALPPIDQFVLSRTQLKEVTEQHGLNFEELLAGLQKRGIELTD